MKLQPNERKWGTAMAKWYFSKFADWDFPEWYWTIATNRQYDTIEGYIRALKKMNDKDFKKELVDNILFDMSEYRKEWRKDKETYYSLGAWNVYCNFQF